MSKEEIDFCGWEDRQCLECPYCEDDQCKYLEELMPTLKWLYLLMKERDRKNLFGWGCVYRYYYGNKEVHEWLIDDFLPEDRNKFWELWRDGGKEAFKKLGFGVIKEGYGWILFWELKFKDIFLSTINEKEEI